MGEVQWSNGEALLEITLRYMMHLRQGGCSAVVAQRRLSGVRFNLLLAFTNRQALKGWKKEGVKTECRRPIILLGRLHGALQEVCVDSFETLLFKVSFSIAFFAALRVGELVPPPPPRLSRKKVGC